VAEVLVDHGNLRVNQVARFLHRRYMRQHQHVKLILNRNLFLKYFCQDSQLCTHLRLLVELYELHARLRRGYK
jgi:hypothetical protein